MSNCLFHSSHLIDIVSLLSPVDRRRGIHAVRRAHLHFPFRKSAIFHPLSLADFNLKSTYINRFTILEHLEKISQIIEDVGFDLNLC